MRALILLWLSLLSAWGAGNDFPVVAVAGGGGGINSVTWVSIPHWTLNGVPTKKLFWSFSKDGTNWFWGNKTNSIFTDPDGGGAWNTTVVQSSDGMFYAEYDAFEGNANPALGCRFTLLSSPDFLNWTFAAHLYHTPTNVSGGMVYASQFFKDLDGSIWDLVPYVDTNSYIYATKALNSSLTSWGPRYAIMTNLISAQTYDPVIINSGSQYVLWAVTIDGAYHRFTNSTLTTLFTEDTKNGYLGVLGQYTGLENLDPAIGPMVHKVSGVHWRAFGEDESAAANSNAGLIVSDSYDNGQTWTAWGRVLNNWSHGAVFPVNNFSWPLTVASGLSSLTTNVVCGSRTLLITNGVVIGVQ
jgi:hypothetical protein